MSHYDRQAVETFPATGRTICVQHTSDKGQRKGQEPIGIAQDAYSITFRHGEKRHAVKKW
eukprot:629709-Amphidinium_carterae.1